MGAGDNIYDKRPQHSIKSWWLLATYYLPTPKINGSTTDCNPRPLIESVS